MEGEVAAAVLQPLVQNLVDLCRNEISQIRDLDKNAAKLTTSLKTIQKFLNDAETRNITSEAVKDWLKNLEDVAFDADNVLDEINYNILSKQIKPAEPEEEEDSFLEELSIWEIGVECLPADWLLSNSETLSHLEIRECRNLREISDRWGEEESEGRSFTITSLPIFPRLTFLRIKDVPKLSLETVDAMRRLQIHGFKRINPGRGYDSKAMAKIGELLRSMEARRPQLVALTSLLVGKNGDSLVVESEEKDDDKNSDSNIEDGSCGS